MKKLLIGLGILSMTLVNNVSADCSSLYFKKALKRQKTNEFWKGLAFVGGASAIGGGLGATMQSGGGNAMRDGFVPGAIVTGLLFGVGTLVTKADYDNGVPNNTFYKVYDTIENAKETRISRFLYSALKEEFHFDLYPKIEQERMLYEVIDLINDENRFGGELCTLKVRNYNLIKFKRLLDLIEKSEIFKHGRRR